MIERTPGSICGVDSTSRTLLCKARASCYSISNMVAGARARFIGLLIHANELLANGIVNKSYTSLEVNELNEVQLGNVSRTDQTLYNRTHTFQMKTTFYVHTTLLGYDNTEAFHNRQTTN